MQQHQHDQKLNRFAWLVLGFAVAGLVAGCAVLTPGTVSPLASPVVTLVSQPVVRDVEMYTHTVTSPDGRVHLVANCYGGGGANFPRCWVTYPNGQRMESSVQTWLPNDLALICEGASHDSSCVGFSIWNVAKGNQVGGFKDYWYQLSADKTAMTYIQPDRYINAKSHLVILDFATEREKYEEICPAWVKLPKWGQGICKDANSPGIIGFAGS